MTKIVTLTINPSVDKNTETEALKADAKLRCQLPVFEPGGGGINVSRAIKKLGGESHAIFPAGGPTGILLKELLEKDDIYFSSIYTEGWSRENLNIVESRTNTQYRFIMPGAHLKEDEWESILDLLSKYRQMEYLVVSGSLTTGVPENFYAEIAKTCKKNNVKCIVDTSGLPLKLAMETGIYLSKPNSHELCQINGVSLENPEDIEEIAKKTINDGKVEVLVISLGAQGALLVTKDFSEHIIAPTVEKRSTVGAGDSMVAGIVLKLSQGATIQEAVRYGVACGSAATLNTGTQLCSKPDADHFYNWIVNKNPIKSK